jgi:UDP-N-acetylglucosamine--N-acetylmuramyl-(pentapeptide) pyrophosphoryl-undecaprenol N-acetylglucosamine transferase
MSSNAPTILFQPVNGIGLGHISRLAAIALAVRNKLPRALLPFAVAGDSHLFLESLGLPHVSFGVHMTGPDPSSWGPSQQNKLIHQIARALVGELQPQAIVFDFIAVPPILQAAMERHIPAVLVIRKSRDMEKYFSQLAPYQQLFKMFILPHDAGDFEIPASMRPRAHFVGQITRVETGNGAAPTAKKTIVITGGGGGYPGTVEFYNTALRALAPIGAAFPETEIVLITGPLFKEWHGLKLIDGVRIIPFEPNMISTLQNAALVLCQGGYNTIAEVSRLGVPTICVPAERPYDDQHERAAQLAAACPHIHSWQGSVAEELSTVISACLSAEKPAKQKQADAPGANAAADLILKMLSETPLGVQASK